MQNPDYNYGVIVNQMTYFMYAFHAIGAIKASITYCNDAEEFDVYVAMNLINESFVEADFLSCWKQDDLLTTKSKHKINRLSSTIFILSFYFENAVVEVRFEIMSNPVYCVQVFSTDKHYVGEKRVYRNIIGVKDIQNLPQSAVKVVADCGAALYIGSYNLVYKPVKTLVKWLNGEISLKHHSENFSGATWGIVHYNLPEIEDVRKSIESSSSEYMTKESTIRLIAQNSEFVILKSHTPVKNFLKYLEHKSVSDQENFFETFLRKLILGTAKHKFLNLLHKSFKISTKAILNHEHF